VDLAPDHNPLPLGDPPPYWLARLRALAGGTMRRLEAGQALMPEGERPSCLWVIHGGAVALASTTSSGRRATVAVLGRGAVLGELGLSPQFIQARPDPTSFLPEARTLIASLACSISFVALRAAMTSDPRVARWVAVAVGRRASQVQRALVRTLAMNVPSRVLGALEDLAAEHGRAGPGEVWIGIPLTQDLLASMVGATRESVNRAIADLEWKGLVRRVGLNYGLPRPSAGSGGGP
jgi:CRP/FNR family cyclic AMP-dependent transcriptional regulator